MGVDGRESFYEAKRRHRWASWRFTAASALAVALLGLPLSVLVSPLVTGLGIMANDVVNLVVPTPDAVAEVRDLSERWSDAVDARKQGKDADLPLAEAATVGVLLLLPGIAVMLLAWLCVRRVFMRSAAGAVVLAAGARPPSPGDLEERQLVNLVEEMALAAGVPPPRVMVAREDFLNAAVVGRSVDNVTIVVPRRLLEELGRDPTSAVIADLLATVVNGDLRAALLVASVFQTFDLVGTVIAAPLSRKTRRLLWRLARQALRPTRRLAAHDDGTGTGAGAGTEAHYIADELADAAALGDLDDDSGGGLMGCLTFPFLAAAAAYTMTESLLGFFFVSPVLARLWRRRRLLADATAVELTRNPDALVTALEHLEARGASVPPGPWAHLFVVGPEVRQDVAKRRMLGRMEELRDEGRRPDESRSAYVRRRMQEGTAAQQEYGTAVDASSTADTTDSLVRSGLDRFLPSLDTRLRRLEALGAQPAATRSDRPAQPKRRSTRGPVATALLWTGGAILVTVLVALLVACGLMLLSCLMALIYIALLFQALLIVVPVLLVNLWLR